MDCTCTCNGESCRIICKRNGQLCCSAEIKCEQDIQCTITCSRVGKSPSRNEQKEALEQDDEFTCTVTIKCIDGKCVCECTKGPIKSAKCC